MKNKIILKIGLAVVLAILIVISSITPMAFGHKAITTNGKLMNEPYVLDRFDKYSVSELHPDDYKPGELPVSDCSSNININRKMVESQQTITSLDGLMDSPWPMFQNDTKHTGRSPYGKTGNWRIIKWKFKLDSFIYSSPSIDKNGIIYLGTHDFYAIYPNGTLKWEFDMYGGVESSPAIDENGTIYFGSEGADNNYFYALYPNGTLKWKYPVSNHIDSSPAIGEDGTIYFGSNNDNLYALYPNGTLKWKYQTSGNVDESPAIDDDGTIYFGSSDYHLYALYPNGTLKWKHNAGCRIGSDPTIADDGTIYFGGVEEGALYALYPNGTRKWKITLGSNVVSSPALAEDGTIYIAAYKAGPKGAYIYSIKPNSSINWRYEVEDEAMSASPAIDKNGIIYIGGWGGYKWGGFYALNPNGTLRWKFTTGDSIHGSAAIGEDGTIYIGSWDKYLYAIEPVEDESPEKPNINGPNNGKPGEQCWFTAVTSDPDEHDVKYGFDWNGDQEVDEWTQDYYESGETVEVSHSWDKRGTYSVKVIAKDIYELEGEWSDPHTIIIPRNKATIFNSFLARLLEKFPIFKNILQNVLNIT